ncbi:hypothetical protein JCM11641_007214 [Rhodosporidiobolus odoratus]
MRRAVAKRAENPPSRALEIVSADTWGPAPIGGLKGERLAVAFVDHASRYLWLETVTTKASIPDLAIRRLRRINQGAKKGKPLVNFQSDNGTESLLETTRTLLIDAGLPLSFWPYALSSAAYLYNLSPSSAIDSPPEDHGDEARQLRMQVSPLHCIAWSGGPTTKSKQEKRDESQQYTLRLADFTIFSPSDSPPSPSPIPPTPPRSFLTPYEAFHGKPPPLQHLQAWGCLAYLRRPSEGRNVPNKLEERGVAARFIGYLEDSKGWIFWVPSERKVVLAWDAVFVEDTFENVRADEENEGMAEWFEEMGRLADESDEGQQDDDPPAEGGLGETVVQQEEQEGEATPSQNPPTDSPSANSSSSDSLSSISPPPAPQPIPDPPIRRSLRQQGIRGVDAPHHVPLDAAGDNKRPAALPDDPPLTSDSITANLAFSTFDLKRLPPRRLPNLPRSTKPVQPPPPSPLLAYAVLDPFLDSDSSASVAVTVELKEDMTRAEVGAALERALMLSPAWTGSHDEPSFKQAMARPDVERWIDAMMAELAAFEATGTWEEDLVELPEGRRAISTKWVLLIKRDADGKIIKYKARLVARGDQQVSGLDYDETFSSTVRLATVRLIFALLAANPRWSYRQFDISNAYLLGVLDQEIYLKQPPGFADPNRPNTVRRLCKAVYGLKQGGREWQKVLRGALEQLGFKRCESDHGLYVRRKEGRVVVVPTHVDDGIVVGDDDLGKVMDELSEKLEGKLKEVETGLFLGMRVKRMEDGSVELDQGHYTRSVLDRFFPDGLSPIATPLESDYSSISPASEDERCSRPYRKLLGALVYLSACTRPDLAFSLSFASPFAACPAERHWNLLTRICRYLSGTSDLGLRYSTPQSTFSASLLSAHCDADHTGDRETRRSVSGYGFCIGDDSLRATAISWLSRRQRSVAISSTEAEYMALSEAVREALWLRALLTDLGYPPSSPTLIRGDNSGCLLLASHPTSHSRTKHISVHYHFTRVLVEDGTLILKWIPTEEMTAAVFTKGLSKAKHFLFTARCGLRDLRREGGC